jgi:hypothetical protein
VAASDPSRRVSWRVGLRLAVSLLALLAAAAPAQDVPPPDVPAGEARIVGRVIQGADDRPVAGVEVVLYALTADGTPGLRRTTSDAQGAYAFDGISNAGNVAYLVGARFHDIPVPGGRVAFAPGEKSAATDIRVADLTSDTSRVRIREQTLRLHREANGLRIEETFALELAGDEIAFVPPAERRRRPPGVRATLPADFADFQMPLGVIPDGLERSGAQQRFFGPFYPGAQELSWSYRLPAEETGAEGDRFRFEVTPAPGAERFAIVVPEGVGAFDAPGLANAGPAGDDGRAATRFAAAQPRRAYTVTLTLPPARIDPQAIAVHEVQILLHADDAAIAVSETHVLAAQGEGLLLGTPESPLLRVPIPAEANDVRFGSEAAGLEFAAHPEGGVAVLGNLSPGEVPIQIAYRVPVGEAGVQLARSFGVRVPLLRVYVADTGRLIPSSARLHRARSVRTEDLNYLALEAFDVDAGEEVALALDPLPPRRPASPAVARAAAALAGLALLAWIVMPFSKRGARPPDAEEAEDGAAARERAAIYDAIRDLDHDFETAKLSAEDYARLRDGMRARAAELIRAEEGGAAAGGQPGAARACAQCGALAASEHRFCAACGAALGAPAA